MQLIRDSVGLAGPMTIMRHSRHCFDDSGRPRGANWEISPVTQITYLPGTWGSSLSWKESVAGDMKEVVYPWPVKLR